MERQEKLMPLWSINHCRIIKGKLLNERNYTDYFSCGVDSVVDLFDYAICSHLSEEEIQNKSELLQLIYQCHQMRQNERNIFKTNQSYLTKRNAANYLIQHRMNISAENNIVWDWLCKYDTQNWCNPNKGTCDAQLHGIPKSLIDTEIDQQLFGLNLLWKCQNGQCGAEMDEHLFPVNLLNCNSIKNGMDENIHSTCHCGTDRICTIETIGEYVLFDLSIIDENRSNFHLEDKLTITGNDQLELIGAIKHTSDHFMTIVEIGSKWCVLDDMQDEPIIADTIETCLNLIDHNHSGKMTGICWLMYRKIADVVINIGDEMSDVETELQQQGIEQLENNLNITTSKKSKSSKAKERKRKRDTEFLLVQKRIIIEEPCIIGTDRDFESIVHKEDQNKIQRRLVQKTELNRMRQKTFRNKQKSQATVEQIEHQREQERLRKKNLREKLKSQATVEQIKHLREQEQLRKKILREEQKSKDTVEESQQRMESMKEKRQKLRLERNGESKGMKHCESCMKILFDLYGKQLSQLTVMSMNLSISENGYLCSICKTAIESNKLPKLCTKNNLKLSEIPDCLKELNFLERRFICRIQTYMTLLVLPGGQKAQKGMAVFFENKPDQLIKILPQTMDNNGIICVSGNYEGYIRPNMIYEALEWLKRNNQLYKNVIIDRNNLENDNEMFDQEELNNFTQSGVIDIELNVPNVTIGEVIGNKPKRIHFPRSKGPPVMFSGERNAEALAWPWLYPNGTGSYDDINQRKVKITLLDYLKNRFLHKDNRFRCDIPYLMAGVNRYETERLKSLCNVYMRIQKVTSKNSENVTTPTTIADLKQILNKSNSGASADDNWLMFMRSVRGTASYWKDQLWDLLAKMKFLGPPDVFVTVSVADMHWIEIEELLREDLGDDYENISDAVRKDPVIVVLYADKKFRELLKWIKYSKVLGTVTDYHARAEFQNRGTVHYHVFFWIADCPGLHKKSSRESIKEYIESIICTELPPEEDAEFRKLVEDRQTHSHTKTCQRPNGKCRFNYPRKVCNETRILFDFETRKATTKGNFYVTKRSGVSLNLNPYNPRIFKWWGANMDIQMIHGERGLAYYICKYVLKAEPEEFRIALRELTDQMNSMEKLTKKSRMMKLGMLMLKMRRMSAQEAAYRITGLKMVHSSRAVQTIGTLPPNKRMRRVLPEEQIEGQLENSTELFYDGPIEVYRKRPKKTEFETMSLFEFTSWYEKEYNQSNWNRCVPLCDGSAYLKKRYKAQVVRSSYVSMASDDYYYTLLLLHLPHREESDLNDGYGSFKESFLSKENLLSTLNLPNEKFVNEILEATRRIRLANEIERLLHVANNETADDEDEGNVMEVDVIEEGLDPAFSGENNEYSLDTNDIDNSERTATHNLLASNWSEETLQENIGKLTKTQLQTLLYIENCVLEKKQILLFITGNAGTGKSYLLNVIIEWLRATQSKIVGEDPVIVGAPTGLAAKNVHGRTLHSLFRLPLQDGQATTTAKLNELSMRKLQMEMKGKIFFICDEISMVGEKNFRMVHERLEQLGAMNTNGKNEKPFGGYHVILSGDFYQLPPVRDKFAFECVELFDLFEIIWLTENMRQKKDKKWCNLLDRLRMSTLTKEDCEMLARRTFPKHVCDEQHAEMRLYPTVRMVTAFNASKQSAMKETKRIFESTDIYSTFDNYGPGCTASLDDLPEDTRKAGGLLQKLELSIGSRVMLTRNLLPTLCNGDQGYVTAFESNSENITSGIIIKFDDENAGDELKDLDFNNHVKIERIDCEYMYKGRIIV